MKKIIKSKILSQFPEIHHGTSTKKISPTFQRDPDLNTLIIDRDKVLEYLNLPPNHFLVSGEQQHTDNVFIIKDKNFSNKIPNTDALISNQKQIHLLVHTADCMPILIYDPVKKVIAIVHSGWEGTVKKIVIKTLEKMQKEFKSERSDIKVYIGPSIGPCCYTAKNTKQIKMFKKYENGIIERKGKSFIDLWGAIEQDLFNFGILPKNFENAKICTSCHNKFFASHRLEGDKRITTNISTIAIV